MAADLPRVEMKNRAAWRRWLQRHHATADGVWLVFYKKHTGTPTVVYAEALDEALCFGWIDSTVNRLDDARYMQRFTPRRRGSGWSEVNKRRVAQLIDAGRMREAGLREVDAAKADGRWAKPRDSHLVSAQEPGDSPLVLPPAFQAALDGDARAQATFDALTAVQRRNYVRWIAAAKTDRTRDARIARSIALLADGKKLGMV